MNKGEYQHVILSSAKDLFLTAQKSRSFALLRMTVIRIVSLLPFLKGGWEGFRSRYFRAVENCKRRKSPSFTL